MINELLDVSINTMIGLLPSITNYNNNQINREFSSIVPTVNGTRKMTVDVSSNNVHAHTGDFDILTVGGQTVLFDNITSTRDRITSLDSSMQYVFDHYYNGLSSASMMRYSASVNETLDSNSADEYNFSSFFTTGGKGKISGITTNELYNKKLYRVIEGLKLSLSIGSIVVGGKVRMMIYHDHIDTTGSNTVVQRVYVTIVDGSDKNSILQYGSASTINLGSSI